MTTPRTRLSALLAESGLSQQAFARTVLGRDPRSLRRYLAGAVVPECLGEWLTSVHRVDTSRDRVTITVRR